MGSTIYKLTANPLGRSVFRLAQPVVHMYRRLFQPGVPPEHDVVSASWHGQQAKVRIRRHTSDRMAVTQCFEQRQYDFPTGVHGEFIQRRYDEIVASGSQPLIIDCGANIGASVLWYKFRYPKAHIVAIEPAPDNFEMLKLNTAGMDVDLRQAGVASCDGVAHLDASLGKGMSYRTLEDASGPSIEMVSVATILSEKDPSRYVPFLIKIDIEGAEKPLFKGDCSAIDRFPLIVLEPHDWLLPGQASSMEFFRFHAAAGREFCMRDENVASIIQDVSLAQATRGFSNAY